MTCPGGRNIPPICHPGSKPNEDSMNPEQRSTSFTRRAALATLGIGGLATVGSIYSKTVRTDIASAQSREVLIDDTRDGWATQSDAGSLAPRQKIGSTIGFLYIPRLRDDVWSFPVVEGTGPRQLNLGIGHLPQTPLPSQEGNVALFGHRTSYGKPFGRFELLKRGDLVVLETKDEWFTYILAKDAQVTPASTWVAKPDPFANPALKGPLPYWKYKPRRILSLITCTPKYSTAMRWVWWATFVSRSSREFPHRSWPRAK